MRKYYKQIRYLAEYLIFRIFFAFLILIGFKRSVQFCSCTARALGPYLKVSKIASKNLQMALGADVDVKRLLDQIWHNFGSYIGEFPFINRLSEQEMQARFVMEGLVHVKKYQTAQKPFLLFLAHQANWDFVIRHITDIYPKFAIIYRKANNPYVDEAILASRSNNNNVLMIPKGSSGAKGLVRAIKGGYAIAMLVDQKMNDGIEVPFFGKPAMTANAIAKLALQYGYPIVPCQLIRTDSGSNFKAKIHPELKINLTGNAEQDVHKIMMDINHILEKWIRQYPGQWFWFHNRWKN